MRNPRRGKENKMIICDGERAVDIRIKKWNGSGYDPDWSQDYFTASCMPRYETVEGDLVYKVNDVQSYIDAAESTDEDGACCKWDENGDAVPDEDMCVFVEELPIERYTWRITDFESCAAALYDGGWRKEDKEDFKKKYYLDEDDADKLAAMLAEMEEDEC